jgi:galactokinase
MASDDPTSTPATPPFRPNDAFVEAPETFDTYEAPDRAAMTERARTALVNQLGHGEALIATAYACGTIGVLADQTHYSEGYGLLMPLQQGVAVAVRPADAPRVVLEGENQAWGSEEQRPLWVTAVYRILQELLSDPSIEVAVASTIPSVCRDGALAALAVALVRVVRRLNMPTAVDLDRVADVRDELVPLLAAELGTVIDQPYSTAYLLATFADPDPPFTLVDTSTREHLPVNTAGRTALRWALIDPVNAEPRSPAFHRGRRRQAETALERLRAGAFEGLGAFRDLEHRDLKRVEEVLSSDLAPVARHLVTENRRVQKHVAAMRRADWQMTGALLLMSHASQRDDWTATPEAADAVVKAVETRTHESLYGACMTGRSGAVLVTGPPDNFERGLRHLVATLAPMLGHTPRILAP